MNHIVRGAYSYDAAANSNEGCIDTWEPSMTQQSQREEADINTIVKRFGLTGHLPDNLRAPTYADYDQIYDYHSAMNAIAEANSTFMKLPADIRSTFDNNPGLFVDYCSNPDNIDKLRELGLAAPKETRHGEDNANRGSSPGGTGVPKGSNDLGSPPDAPETAKPGGA